MILCGGGEGRVVTLTHKCTYMHTHNITSDPDAHFFGGGADDTLARVAGYVVSKAYLPAKGGERACNSYSCIEGEMLAVTKSDML